MAIWPSCQDRILWQTRQPAISSLWELMHSVCFLSPGGGLLSGAGVLPKAVVSVASKGYLPILPVEVMGAPSLSVSGVTRESCSYVPCFGVGDGGGVSKMDTKLEDLFRHLLPSPYY